MVIKKNKAANFSSLKYFKILVNIPCSVTGCIVTCYFFTNGKAKSTPNLVSAYPQLCMPFPGHEANS